MTDKAIWITAGLLLVCVIWFMTIGSRGNWEFVLNFRGKKLIALLLVAVSVSTSTLVFQTITRNRILTPSIMGFDALYVLLLTFAVFTLGSIGYGALPPALVFAVNLVLMLVASLALFGTLLGQRQTDLMRMILTGIIFGVLFRSLTSFMQRMIDPNEFTSIQVASYANFNRVDTTLLWVSAILTCVALAVIWRLRHNLDVLSLGYETATNLGEPVFRRQLQVLFLVALLVAISTSLVGPVIFLGLLVVSIARAIAPNESHAVMLPLASGVAAIVLVGGQTILERVMGLSTPLVVVIDFVGGLVFLILILREGRR
ncbi:iron chelate uptake ABC transporter family permease subunit [Shimia thalassica]|uniref:iron chelate uptake ABC transporter family permease subunit n=1 Tax=Shimia thalassica TaxID=1715693 RepID=UPI001C085C77|nr:iron chelate uptake ABC transporter family permease subunit [Shimia thalassica]MBU2941086.1 iron chelate uptake ABC transporter family permease subunit [Shimia thalassica]MDO6503430.1 iron chelate uptake ABC transporter family permease subunit [Shimia thalassica]